MLKIKVRVPATTANLGAGFNCLGMALELYNTLQMQEARSTSLTKIVKAEFNSKWDDFLSQSYAYYGNPGGLSKNPLAIARALKIACDQNCKSTELNKLIDNIIAFAKK